MNTPTEKMNQDLADHLVVVTRINELTCDAINSEEEIDLEQLEVCVQELQGQEVMQGLVPGNANALKSKAKNSISIEDAETYSKLVFFSMLRGDIHACMIWVRKATEEYFKLNGHQFRPLSDIPIAESDSLPVRDINALDKAGYIFWGQLANVKRETLFAIENFGEAAYMKVITELQRIIRRESEIGG